MNDLQAEHQREMEGLLDSVRQLSRELRLQMLIIDSFVPPHYQVIIHRLIRKNLFFINIYISRSIRNWSNVTFIGTRKSAIGSWNASPIRAIICGKGTSMKSNRSKISIRSTYREFILRITMIRRLKLNRNRTKKLSADRRKSRRNRFLCKFQLNLADFCFWQGSKRGQAKNASSLNRKCVLLISQNFLSFLLPFHQRCF